MGFGWPWSSYWNGGLFWGSYWNDPWWGWPGYGYYGYPAGYMHGDHYGDDDSYSAPPENYPSTDSSAPVAQSQPETSTVENSVVPVLLYMKDGSVYSARDYWLSGGQLHYVLLSGAEGVLDVDQLDVQRTVDENAKSGVPFTLKPDPNSFESLPETPPATAPAPAPGNNPVPQPQSQL